MELDVTVNVAKLVKVREKRTVTLPFCIERDTEGASFVIFENGKFYETNQFHRTAEPFHKREIPLEVAQFIIEDTLEVRASLVGAVA